MAHVTKLELAGVFLVCPVCALLYATHPLTLMLLNKTHLRHDHKGIAAFGLNSCAGCYACLYNSGMFLSIQGHHRFLLHILTITSPVSVIGNTTVGDNSCLGLLSCSDISGAKHFILFLQPIHNATIANEFFCITDTTIIGNKSCNFTDACISMSGNSFCSNVRNMLDFDFILIFVFFSETGAVIVGDGSCSNYGACSDLSGKFILS